jgi:hypothetical protein
VGEDPAKPISRFRLLLGLDYIGDSSRMLTPQEILFTKKQVLRSSYLWLTAGVVASGMLGLGLNHAPWPGYSPERELTGLIGFVIVCVGYPLLCVLRTKADLSEGKAATISGPVAQRKISSVSTLFFQVSSKDFLEPPLLKVVKAAYEQLSVEEMVTVDYLPRTRVVLRICKQNQAVPLWAADPSAPARWFR